MLRVLRAFDDERLEYVLIGATAMGFHGLVRATEDVDIFIRATVENVERLKRAFRAAYANDPTSTRSVLPTFWETIPRSATTRRAGTSTSA